MTFAQFDSGKKPLQELLKSAETGLMQLPDFQRGWVWDDYGIRSLIASISQSFPVGALMTLQTGGEINFKPRPIEGRTGIAPLLPPETLLLDGQQRITSLYLACFQDKVIETLNAQRRRIRRWYYIDMAAALDPDTDREDAIVGVPETRQVRRDFGRELVLDLSSAEQEYALGMFPLNRIFAPDAWQMGYFEYWAYDSERIRFWMEFKNRILAAFDHYHVPVITLGKQTPKEAVCLVFEKVNTGGRKLDAFELLTAIFAADARDFNLRHDWYGDPDRPGTPGRRALLAEYNVLKELASVDFLQAVALLHTYDRRRSDVAAGQEGKDLTPVSCTRQAILNLSLDAYLDWKDAVTEGFVTAAKFLIMEKIYWHKDVPYKTQLVPLAAILALLGRRWDEHGVREKLARWYWCGVFGELYGSAIETRFAKDVPEVLAWLDGGPEPGTVQEFGFSPDRFYTLRSRLSAAYKGMHAMLMRSGARDFRSGQPFEYTSYFEESVDIHHVFPRAWAQKRKDIDRGQMDSIVNKTPLSARTNRIIGGEAPSRYLPRIANSAGTAGETVDAFVASHLIDSACLRADDFEAFYERRTEALLRLIEQATGKPIARRAPADEDMGEVVEEELEAAE